MKQKIPAITTIRLIVQWAFLAWCIFLGIQFGLFVSHFESFGQTAYYGRPPGVEGFLPIGALVSFKNWISSGQIDPVHPAALVLLLTFVAMALLAKKSFCSWLCPVGTLEEGLWKVGRKLFGRNFRIWRWLDLTLSFTRYALLFFFIKTILIDMPVLAVQGFLNAPYWAIADIKMLHFFTAPSTTSIIVITLLSLLSVFYKNVWCRYLCPYGALLGLFSMLSPLKIRRNHSTCINCGTCSKACPALIDVQHKTTVHSPECTACLTCVGSCPAPGALDIGLSKPNRTIPGWGFALFVLLIFTAGVCFGMLTGHWETALTYDDYRALIPQTSRFGH
ncbi:MAG: 4Fe-4S binding protein [Desulfuromonas sp.]|nr:MAG: 4Fe-4S binding protein [Desulfuromonas sp.]